MWRDVQRWRGVILIGISVVATLGLMFGNQLVLYIHPRYIVFTIIMAALALLFVAGSIVLRPHLDDDHEPRRRATWLSATALLLASVVAVSMIVLPPATLTSATASQRDINSTMVGTITHTVSEVDAAPTAAFANFTVVDWSSLLRQTNDLSFYDGKPVDVTGFITPDEDDPQNVFYVSRFVVTCCAVDAQPAGVPVYLPNWEDAIAIDDWVRVTGEFGANPSQKSKQGLALNPDGVAPVEQPSEPYLY